jgi:hypothetical protein
MKKRGALMPAICLFFVFTLIFSAHYLATAANTSVTVLSYSSYVSPTGNFVVLGEIQNTCSHALDSVTLNVIVSASDESIIAEGTTEAFVRNFLPDQKAPFYIDFGKIDFDLISKSSIFSITLNNAPPTNYDQYRELSVNIDNNGISDTAYMISGAITNNGNQTANNVIIYGTYYNTAGIVVAIGSVELDDPLTPNASIDFTLGELDESASLTTKISSYALLVQTSNQFFAPPSASPSDTIQTSDSLLLIIGIVAASLIAVIAILIFVRFRLKK